MTFRFLKPSFRTSNSSSTTCSPSGKYIAQFGERISVWDIAQRKKSTEHKLIKNESYIGFSEDEELMVAKNTNGELVFCKTHSGEVISSTGRFRRYMEGSRPCFSECGKLLYDPSWGHGLKVWETGSAECVGQYDFDGWTLSGLVKLSGSSRYVFASSSRHPRVGYSKLHVFSASGDKLQFREIPPPEPKLKNEDVWQDIDTLAISAATSSVVLVVRPNDGGELLVNVNLETDVTVIQRTSRNNHRTESLSSNDDIVATVVHRNPPWTAFIQGVAGLEREQRD